MIFAADAMNRFDQRERVFRRCELRNAMTEIEDMTVPFAETGKNFFYFSSNHFRPGEKNCRIQIPLQGDLVTHAPARLCDIDGPVQPDCIATTVRDTLKP